MVQRDQLFDQNLEHIGHALEYTVGAYSIGTQTALEEGAHLTLEIDVEQGQHRIQQQQRHAYQYKFNQPKLPSRALHSSTNYLSSGVTIEKVEHNLFFNLFLITNYLSISGIT